jgi:O-antigen/teichoic acid export membrane protein
VTIESEPTARPPLDARAATQAQIRGSTLMTVGRLASLAVTFVTQILVVRYLSKSDYGALAYALAVVAFIQPFLSLGLDLADTRFFALYDEQRDRARLAGLVLLELSIVLGLGALLVLAVVLLRGALAGTLTHDQQAIRLLVLLVATAPVQALDAVVLDMFAVFSGPRAVFVRRFVLAPGLRLVAVLVVIAGGFGVAALAVGYLVAGVAGTVIYAPMFVSLLRRIGILQPLRSLDVVVPTREVLKFGLPLLSTGLVVTLSTTLGAIVLGHTHASAQVAAFRAVQPIAVLVTVVQTSFAILFQPLAARLFARGDRAGLADLYWQTSAWLAVLTFPIGALAVCFAHPVVVTLFGDRYASSGTYLAILAAASYIQAASGFNGATLQVIGRLRFLVVSNLVVASLSVVANILLVRWAGALGAAWATAGTIIAHNVVKQSGLIGAGIKAFDRRYAQVFISVTGALVALWAFDRLVNVPIVLALLVVTVCAAAVLRLNRARLDAASTFPALSRIPLLRLLVG